MTAADQPLDPQERRLLLDQLRRNWRDEMRSAHLYERLAMTQPEGEERRLLLEMSGHELRHALRWRTRLLALGGRAPGRVRTGLRELLLPMFARIGGLGAVIGLIEGGEARGTFDYIRQARLLPDAESRAIAAATIPDERLHQGTAAMIRGDGARLSSAHLGAYVRDLVFGLNDGLVSNFSLLAGVGGADVSHRVVILAGVAGLIAGATSMAAGGYISAKSQREVTLEAVQRKREEIEFDPDEERAELRRIYRLKGFDAEETEILVRRISADRERFLEVLVTEELGLAPDPGPPPALDAIASGAGFGAGALVPLIPFLVATGTGTLAVAGALSLLALFGLGALKTLVTRRSAMRGGAEMVAVGFVAAAVTFIAGHLIAGGGTA